MVVVDLPNESKVVGFMHVPGKVITHPKTHRGKAIRGKNRRSFPEISSQQGLIWMLRAVNDVRPSLGKKSSILDYLEGIFGGNSSILN